MIKKLARMAMLYDFYGQLLTEKQQAIMELFYSDDLSLSEIAEEYGISRQAVFDILKRAENTLETYELKLQLLKKFKQHQERITYIGELVDLARKSRSLDYLEKIADIIEEINDLERK
ncbi:MAG: YlxM family DNA-binding protein [Bacillota bacterium]